MKLAKKKYEDIIFNSRFSSNLKKKKIYVISGDTLTNSISNEEENSIFTFSNSKNKSTNFIFPYIPRTTSIYTIEDTHLFYLVKEYFNKTLLTKF